jgi:hypothetical protein
MVYSLLWTTIRHFVANAAIMHSAANVTEQVTFTQLSAALHTMKQTITPLRNFIKHQSPHFFMVLTTVYS